MIHSAIHAARPDLQAVLHTHTRDGIAVSAQKGGLLLISQHSLAFSGRIAYHRYEGVAQDLGERERLVADLGDKSVMLPRNDSLLTAGVSVRAVGMKGHQRPVRAGVFVGSGNCFNVVGLDRRPTAVRNFRPRLRGDVTGEFNAHEQLLLIVGMFQTCRVGIAPMRTSNIGAGRAVVKFDSALS